MAKVTLTKTTTSDPLGTVNRLKTYVGFSTVNRDFDANTLYDYELARTDLLNAFYIKKGEKLENPNYGTIIHDTLFEPFTPEISKAIEEDVIDIVDKDPRWVLETLRIDQAEYGLNLAIEITYVPYNIGESLTLSFNEETGLDVTSNPIDTTATATQTTSSY